MFPVKGVSAPAVSHCGSCLSNISTDGECLGELSRDSRPISDLVSMKTPLVPAMVWVVCPPKVQTFGPPGQKLGGAMNFQ